MTNVEYKLISHSDPIEFNEIMSVWCCQGYTPHGYPMLKGDLILQAMVKRSEPVQKKMTPGLWKQMMGEE